MCIHHKCYYDYAVFWLYRPNSKTKIDEKKFRIVSSAQNSLFLENNN